jgi:hypothetical protein
VVSLVPRLKIEWVSIFFVHIVFLNRNSIPSELPAHLLALILATTGIIGIFLHIIHRGARKRLLLATPPGSIASVVALTSRSGFGELLLPYDDELTLEKKLDGLRFRLDRRTGAILADDHVREGTIADEAMLALFGEERAETMDMNHSAVESLSLLASQAASQSLRWQRSWVPAELSPLQQHSNTPRQAASVSGQPKPVQHGRGRLKKSAGSENVKPASQQVFAGVVLGKWNPTDQAASEPPVEEGDKDGDGEVDEESEDPILTAINGNGNEDLSSLGESNKGASIDGFLRRPG